jgi:hypothetical protein
MYTSIAHAITNIGMPGPSTMHPFLWYGSICIMLTSTSALAIIPMYFDAGSASEFVVQYVRSFYHSNRPVIYENTDIGNVEAIGLRVLCVIDQPQFVHFCFNTSPSLLVAIFGF